MSKAETVYCNVEYEKMTGRRPGAITCSSDETSKVWILESEAPAELPAETQLMRPVSQQGAAELKGPAQVRRRDVALLVLSLLLAAAVSALAASLNNNVQTKDQLQKLQFDHEALKRNLSDLENVNVEIKDKLQSCDKDLEKIASDESCLKYEGDWEQHGGRCYRFSSIHLSWNDSKSSCIGQQGYLVKIDSREEQTFLKNKVTEKRKHSGDLFWIGLTDSDTEGDWRWTDGSALDKSLSFWGGQPDNWKGMDPDGEDCVIMGNSWGDYSCKAQNRWICEKQAEQKGGLQVCK